VSARRILAVLECCPSDEEILAHAVAAASESGGYLTLVAVVPSLPRWLHCSPYCVPRSSPDELRQHASAALARAAAQVPPEIPLLTALETGKPRDVIARRVAAAAHDLVVVRRRRGFSHVLTRPAAAT
jgi:nucleotide-binding universal stress UspA family protein